MTDGRGGDALGDGPIANPDGDPSSCITDNFVGSGSGTCGTSQWGSPTSGGSGVAYLTNTGTGELQLTTFGSPSAFVTCLSASAAWNRVIVDVQAVAATATADRTFVGLQSADGTQHWGVEFYDFGGSPGYSTVCDDGGPTSQTLNQWDSSTQHYIKVERTGPAEMSIFLSDNTATFSRVDDCAPQAAMIDSAATQLRVFKNAAQSGPSATALFRSIELCHN
jgi:hypothetical protein